jgi:hypothetical protein
VYTILLGAYSKDYRPGGEELKKFAIVGAEVDLDAHLIESGWSRSLNVKLYPNSRSALSLPVQINCAIGGSFWLEAASLSIVPIAAAINQPPGFQPMLPLPAADDGHRPRSVE